VSIPPDDDRTRRNEHDTQTNMTDRLRVAAVEPYFGGSHRHFLEGLRRFSRHDVQLFTLPPRLWKWRMRGGALHLSRALNEAAASGGPFDALLCSDFVNVPDLRALLTPALRARPLLFYLHENQIGYPLSPDEEFDPYFGFTNVLSCLSAEAIVFNSDFHRRDFMARMPTLLPRLPDYDPTWVVDNIEQRAEVLPVGLDLEELETLGPQSSANRETSSPKVAVTASGRTPRSATSHAAKRPRRILWNHRWEFDKAPERFFAALQALSRRDVPFNVDVAGESFERRPAVFDEARARLGDRIGQFGMVEDRSDYIRLLWNADIVVSTSHQEYFGISMAEAVWCGAWPIAPRALVYEDFYGGAETDQHLYRDDEELVRLLEHACTTPNLSPSPILRERLAHFDWRAVALRFDSRFEKLCGNVR
jgi:glycosyltransferase involved in cell wall biosynthesis